MPVVILVREWFENVICLVSLENAAAGTGTRKRCRWKSIVLLFGLRTSESYLVYVISCSSKILVPILESFPVLFSATDSDYCSVIQNNWFASKEAGLLQTAVITTLQCLLQTMCMHLKHWRSHKNTCHSRWSPWRRWWARAKGIQAGAEQAVNHIPLRLNAAVRCLIFSGLPPRESKQPEQMETHHKVPLKFVCEINKAPCGCSPWSGLRCRRALGSDAVLKEAQSVHVHLSNFDSPQESRWLVFAFVMNSRRQGLSKVKVCLVGVTPRRSYSVPCASCSSPGWFGPW